MIYPLFVVVCLFILKTNFDLNLTQSFVWDGTLLLITIARALYLNIYFPLKSLILWTSLAILLVFWISFGLFTSDENMLGMSSTIVVSALTSFTFVYQEFKYGTSFIPPSWLNWISHIQRWQILLAQKITNLLLSTKGRVRCESYRGFIGFFKWHWKRVTKVFEIADLMYKELEQIDKEKSYKPASYYISAYRGNTDWFFVINKKRSDKLYVKWPILLGDCIIVVLVISVLYV